MASISYARAASGGINLFRILLRRCNVDARDSLANAEDPQRKATFPIQTARQAMVKPFPSRTHIGNHMLHPETLMLNYGYDPQLSEGAVKPPVFLTSTFVFRTPKTDRTSSISSRVGASLPRGWARA